MPEGAWVDGVHGLPQVELELLGGAAPMPVEGDGGDRAGHERDADAGAESVGGRQDRVPSGKGDRDPGLCPGEADVREQVVEGPHGIERNRWGRRRFGRDVGVASVRCPA